MALATASAGRLLIEQLISAHPAEVGFWPNSAISVCLLSLGAG
jgi:hypothetical protein